MSHHIQLHTTHGELRAFEAAPSGTAWGGLVLLFGVRDPLIPAGAISAERAPFPEAQVELFPAGRGFNSGQRDDFHAPSAARALQVSAEFLRQAPA